MAFDPSPEAMAANGQMWYPGDHNRIRWWTPEGRCAVVRPSAPADESTSKGTDGDALWAYVGRLDRETSCRVFAEWIVSRPDLGLSVTATMIEVAVSEYYRRLGDAVSGGVRVGDALGQRRMRELAGQFSSASPTFCILSDTGKAPVVVDVPEEVARLADSCDNVLPMKKSVYYRKRALTRAAIRAA